jgi:hypothetical protein
VVTGNGTAAETSGSGVIFNYGNNDSNGNTIDNFGTLTKIATQ